MKPFNFRNAKFVASAVAPKGYPILRDDSGHLVPEIAVAGRSNVGKSSLLNNLFQSKGLVKTSSTPGKTQLLNFFSLDDRVAFVDLPGYGYAAVSQKVRQKWGPMIQNYLSHRNTLKLILFLFDIRRTPNADDLQLLEWIIQNDKAMILVLTKVDKVTLNEKNKNTREILKGFGADNIHYIHYSSLKDVGRRELMGMLKDALQNGDENNE